MTLSKESEKVLERIIDERNMHACAVGHGYDSNEPVKHKIFEKGWENAKTHHLPIIRSLLVLIEVQHGALKKYQSTPYSYQQTSKLVRVEIECALSAHAKTFEELGAGNG